MTDEELQAIKARCEAATPGPWVVQHWTDREGYDSMSIDAYVDGANRGDVLSNRDEYANEEFIAHARENVSALLAEVERLMEDNRGLRAEAKAAIAAYNDARAEVNRLHGIAMDGISPDEDDYPVKVP